MLYAEFIQLQMKHLKYNTVKNRRLISLLKIYIFES